MQMSAHRCKWTLVDEHKENCVRCVGGYNYNLKTRPDIKTFAHGLWDVL